MIGSSTRPSLPSRTRAIAGAAVLALALTGCGGGFDIEEWEGPGQNARSGDVLLRYARLGSPPVDNEQFPAGSDVPLYLWLVNEGEQPDALVSVTTEGGEDVVVVAADGQPAQFPVELPPTEDVQLGVDDDMHLVVLGIEEPMRAGDNIPMTFTFEQAGEIATMVHARVPASEEVGGY
jgi:copper(I)-binding protein